MPSVSTSAGLARSNELERLITEQQRLDDPALTFSRLVQTPPPRPYSVAKLGPFPTTAIARVVAYTFGRARVPKPCAAEALLPFTSAGTLCPDVVSPGTELSDDERKRVEKLVVTATEALEAQKKTSHIVGRPVFRCGFDPHHAVAFYDAKGNVLAKMLVCFSCGEWLVSPSSEALGGARPVAMTDEERSTLAALFDARGLGAFWFSDGPLAREVFAYERATYGTEDALTPAGVARRTHRLAPGSGAPKTVTMRDLSAADRKKVCDWIANDVRPAGRAQGNHGYQCDDGREWSSAAAEPDCATTVPPKVCEKTVAEVEACARVFKEPDDLCRPAPRECTDVLVCLPGLRLRGPKK